jgi:hypothetical protein
MTTPDYTSWWWRADGTSIYAQQYGEPTNTDALIGSMTTPELAAVAVADHNAATPPPGGF